MSFPIVPLQPFVSSGPAQSPIRFGNTPPEKKDPLSFLTVKTVEKKHLDSDSMVQKETKWADGISGISLITLFSGGSMLAIFLESHLILLMTLAASVLLALNIKGRDVKAIEERAEVREQKADALRPQIEYATSSTLDNMLAEAKAKKLPVVLYFPLQRNNAGEALLHDVRGKLITTGPMNIPNIRFIRYNLLQPGSPEFSIPPTNLKPESYPCLMVLDGDGNTVLKEVGILNRNSILKGSFEPKPEDLAKDIHSALNPTVSNDKT